MYKTITRGLASILIIFSLLASLSGCGSKYVSSYRATMLVRSQTTDSCRTSFGSLDGTLVFKLKYTKSSEGQIIFNASVEEGRVDVYFDAEGFKSKFFTAEGGYPTEGYGGYLERGYTVYIILEAKDAKNGKFEFRLGRQ